MKRYPSVFLFLLFFCICALTLLPSESMAEKKSVTVMIYLTGSDLESEQGAASKDIVEMISSGYDTDKVNVVLFAGGTTLWHNGFPADSCGIYRINEKKSLVRIAQAELMNMGNPLTLFLFLNWCKENCPAERYDLILWDHGGGPLLGVCSDRQFQGDTLTVNELKDALMASPFNSESPLELIGFDACLMSAFEVASACAPYAKYMIASEEIEPGGGWDYRYLKGLEQDQDGAATGRRIIDQYFEANEDSIKNGTRLSMTCLDLSGMTALRKHMDTLFTTLGNQLTENSFGEISRLRESSESIGRKTGAEYDLVDLEDLLMHFDVLTNGLAAKTIEALSAMITYHRSTESAICGLSAYFPFFNRKNYIEYWNSIYNTIDGSSAYSRYIDRYGKLFTGTPLGHWLDLITRIKEKKDEIYHFTIQLTEEQQQNYASSSLLILQEKENEYYYPIYETQEVYMDEQGVLHAEYSNEVLSAVDENGNCLTDALPFRKIGDSYLISVILERGYTDWKLESAFIACSPDKQTGTLQINGIYTIDDSGMITVQNPMEWQYVVFRIDSRQLARDSGGQYLSFYQCERMSGIYGYEIPAVEIEGFVLKHEIKPDQKRYALFQLMDTQGNTYGSQPVEMEEEKQTSADVPVQKLLDNDDFMVRLSTVYCSPDAVTDRGLVFNFEAVTKNANDNSYLHVDCVVVNQTVVPWSFDLSDSAKSFSRSRAVLPFYMLKQCGVNHIHQITFECSRMSKESIDRQYAKINFALDLDLSDYYSLNPEKKPISVSQKNGIAVELLDCHLDTEDLSLLCQIRINNESDNDINWSPYILPDTCMINGYTFSGVEASMFDAIGYYCDSVYCSSSASAFYSLKIKKAKSDSNYIYEACENYYQFFGISLIEQIQFAFSPLNDARLSFNSESYYRVGFNLPEPISVPSVRSVSRTLLLEQAGLCIYLEKLYTYENKNVFDADNKNEQGVILSLVVENYTGNNIKELCLGNTASDWSDGQIRLNNHRSFNNSIYFFDPLQSGATVFKSVSLLAREPGNTRGYALLPLNSISFPFTIVFDDHTIYTSPITIAFDNPVTSFGEILGSITVSIPEK